MFKHNVKLIDKLKTKTILLDISSLSIYIKKYRNLSINKFCI